MYPCNESCHTQKKEPYLLSKEPYLLSKEPYLFSKEPYNFSKEPNICSTEPCNLQKETHTHTSAISHVT